ncbi:eukaryotic translation initiation factor 2 subunit beta-like [Primulina huaijiensis]|uniref:eukaryotic translation initiation factor 2 subunit beta-like n=1 Tax=Primulina huaijiensis TaxID=1492673 RepID=UPI003CC6EAD9
MIWKIPLKRKKEKELSCNIIHGKEAIFGGVLELSSFRPKVLFRDTDLYNVQLLGRVFNILRENNPELAGDRRRTVMRPPQVLREGTKKTVFVNFMDLCKTMCRQPEHVMTFLLAEMGTSGSLDGQQRLAVKGRIEACFQHFLAFGFVLPVDEYVICNGCKSPDTILSKENRLFFLRCEKCGSGRSVVPIKAGFVARVGRRKAGT